MLFRPRLLVSRILRGSVSFKVQRGRVVSVFKGMKIVQSAVTDHTNRQRVCQVLEIGQKIQYILVAPVIDRPIVFCKSNLYVVLVYGDIPFMICIKSVYSNSL